MKFNRQILFPAPRLRQHAGRKGPQTPPFCSVQPSAKGAPRTSRGQRSRPAGDRIPGQSLPRHRATVREAPPALPFKRGRSRLCPAPTRPLPPPPQGHPDPAPALPEGGAAAPGFSRNAGGNGAGGGGAAAGGSSAARARPARGIVGRKVVGAAKEAAGGGGGGERSAAESPRANGGRAGLVPLGESASCRSPRL